MSKINLDKYYTLPETAQYCIGQVYDIIGKNNISEVIEPSAGNGSFSLQIPTKCLAYDIEPEHRSIIKQDFLGLKINYMQGRLIIGNPPFGERNALSVRFYKKSIEMADYIAFILPISQYNNNQQMYEFDLIHSEQLPLIEYSGIKLLTCFNIYKRPSNGIFNNKQTFKLIDVEVCEYRRGGTYKKPDKYDFGMCSWGNSLGKEIEYIGQYAQENYITVKNEYLKSLIIDLCKKTDWKNLYPYISSPKIQTWKICKYLKQKIPELK